MSSYFKNVILAFDIFLYCFFVPILAYSICIEPTRPEVPAYNSYLNSG